MKKKKGIKAIIGTVIVASLFGAVGQMLGEKTVEMVYESDAEKEIQEYIDNMEEYEPGDIGETYYKSDFWEIRFDTNNSWVMYTDEELALSSENVRQSAVSSGMASIEGEDVSQELVDKLFESMYAQTEMGAVYVESETILGEATMNVMGMYGMEGASEEEVFGAISQALASQTSSTELGERVIAGETYKMAKVDFNVDGMDLVNYMFVRFEDGMVCTLNCKYVAGYDYILDSFLEQISLY